MGRTATGSVDFHGSPPRWWARVTIKLDPALVKPGGKKTKREWIDLERPDLKNDTAGKATAKNLARSHARIAKTSVFVGSADAARPNPASGQKLDDLRDTWFAHITRDPDTKRSTARRYRTAWAGAITPHLGARAVTELTPSLLKDWIWSRRAVKAASTVRSDASALTRFFKDAIAEKWVPFTTNPMRDSYVRDALPTTETPELENIVHFSRGQVETLLASPIDDYDFGSYLFATLAGPRDGEQLGVQFGDLRTDEEGIEFVQLLRQALPPDETGGLVEFDALKTKNSKRKIPLHPLLVTWLTWWEAEGWKARVGRDPKPDDVIFPSPTGEAWRPRTAEDLRRDLTAAGLPETFTTNDGTEEPFVTHSFRHTFASMLGDNDIMGEVIDRLLGHAPASTRGKHYQAVKLGPLARAIETLELTLPDRNGVGRRSRIVQQSSRRRSSPAKNSAGQRMK